MGTGGRRQRDFCPVEKGRSVDARVERNGLLWDSCLPSGTMVTSSAGLLPRAMSGCVAFPEPQSVLVSMAPVTTKFCEDARGLVHYIRLHWCLRVMPPQGPTQSGWPGLPPGAMA